MAYNIWKFHVKEGLVDDFVRMNTDDWPELFRRSHEYLGTTIRKLGDLLVYVTMDEWTSKSAFDEFLEKNRSDFDELSHRHKELCESCEHIDFYE